MTNQTAIKTAAEGHILVDLSDRGLLSVSNDDANTFLQGQVTNDVTLLDANTSHLTGYCSPKGRLLALFYAYKHNGAIHLSFDQASLAGVMKRLTMYVLRAKVEIQDATATTIRLGVAGEHAASYLQAIFSAVPENANETIAHDDATLIRLPFITPAFEIVTNAAFATTLKPSLAKDFTTVDAIAWDWLEIQSGIPNITIDTKEAFIPQMVNLDILDGINFKKGCYTGQEIVARTHYLGKVKRRTVLAHVASNETPKAGDTVWDQSTHNVGQIVRACLAYTEGFDVLFEARIESINTGGLHWENYALTLKTMPYDLPMDA